MNFLRFPFLVQSEIIQHFDYDDIFLLSLSSSKCARFIRKLKLNPRKLQHWIQYGDSGQILSDKSDEKSHHLLTWQAVEKFKENGNVVKLQVARQIVEFRYYKTSLHANYEYYMMQYLKSTEPTVNFIFCAPVCVRVDIRTNYGHPNRDEVQNSDGWYYRASNDIKKILISHQNVSLFRIRF